MGAKGLGAGLGVPAEGGGDSWLLFGVEELTEELSLFSGALTLSILSSDSIFIPFLFSLFSLS